MVLKQLVPLLLLLLTLTSTTASIERVHPAKPFASSDFSPSRVLSNIMSPKEQAVTSNDTLSVVEKKKTLFDDSSPLLGLWELDQTLSHSLAPFLTACGAPRLVSPLFGKALDKLMLKIHLDNKSRRLFITYQQSGWKMPIKLQTDADYDLSTTKSPTMATTRLDTPRGPQLGRIVEYALDKIKVLRTGPAIKEQVEEVFYINPEKTILTLNLTHTDADSNKVTRVERVYRRQEAQE